MLAVVLNVVDVEIMLFQLVAYIQLYVQSPLKLALRHVEKYLSFSGKNKKSSECVLLNLNITCIEF